MSGACRKLSPCLQWRTSTALTRTFKFESGKKEQLKPPKWQNLTIKCETYNRRTLSHRRPCRPMRPWRRHTSTSSHRLSCFSACWRHFKHAVCSIRGRAAGCAADGCVPRLASALMMSQQSRDHEAGCHRAAWQAGGLWLADNSVWKCVCVFISIPTLLDIKVYN